MFVVVNPASAGGRGARRARQHLDDLRDAGLSLEVRETRRPWHAVEISRDGYDRGFRDFLAVGGDGTALEVLNGALPPSLEAPSLEAPSLEAPPLEEHSLAARSVEADESLRLGVLPVGTGNSFAHHLTARTSSARSWHEQARAVTRAVVEDRAGPPRTGPCDILKIRHGGGEIYVLGSLACGLPATVADLVNRRLKKLGRPAYTLGALLEVMRRTPIDLRASGKSSSARLDLDGPLTFYCIQNIGTTGGNMWMAPDADERDGLFDLVTVAETSRAQLLLTLPRLFRGTHTTHPAVTIRRLQRLDVHDCPPQIVMLDGEIRQLELESIEVLPGAISTWIP